MAERVRDRQPLAMPPRGEAISALRLMRNGGFRRVPVVGRGSVIGVVPQGAPQASERDQPGTGNDIQECV